MDNLNRVSHLDIQRLDVWATVYVDVETVPEQCPERTDGRDGGVLRMRRHNLSRDEGRDI